MVFCLSLAWRGHADPLRIVDLAGTWTFTPAGGRATTIQVPGGGWYKQGFVDITEADYETSITVPAVSQAQVTQLELGAVNYQADLYLDDKFIDSRVQSFTPALFDLTRHVAPGGTYRLRLHVKGGKAFMVDGKSLVPNAAGWSKNTPQGIFRSARLLIYPQVHISDVFVRTSVKTSTLSYDVTLHNASADPVNIVLKGDLKSWNGDAWKYPALPAQTVSLPANANTKVTVGPIPWPLEHASYWWPNVPYRAGYRARLHRLDLTLSPAAGGAALDQSSTRFGFRELLQGSDGKNTCYFLNGVRVNFRGDNLQGADYDSIDRGGRGDAYDTLPGFLPGAKGWPKAVDNYQRLNYNFVRVHQEPATPYMLDVCDEMGLMLMEETAIRGSANDQDFARGHDQMVSHLKALFTRDRNHPAIVRQSVSNEPNQSPTDSVPFEVDLYNAAMSVDGTRPLSIDIGNPINTYESIKHANLSVYRHYGTGTQFGRYTDEVFARPDRPFGEGEFIWYADDTAQGLAWFATATQEMRAKGASDIRPYTLLSAWSSFVPGVRAGDMQLETADWGKKIGHPLYGEDNLPEPWSNPQIQRVQAAFNPVLVADADYWSLAKLSDAQGSWPASVPVLGPAQAVTRKLTIYNDTFDGVTTVNVSWELRQDSATGPAAASGVVDATVPPGYPLSRTISFTTPRAPNGSSLYLVLAARKSGLELFRESSERFLVLSQTRLTGTAFGSTPAYGTKTGYEKASDGDQNTFFDYKFAEGGYTGIDLGAGNARRVSSIVFTPRAGFESRMVGGVFQGSNDGKNYTTFYTVSAEPSANTTAVVNTPQAYRYLRYLAPDKAYGNIAEMGFYAPD